MLIYYFHYAPIAEADVTSDNMVYAIYIIKRMTRGVASDIIRAITITPFPPIDYALLLMLRDIFYFVTISFASLLYR